jgi:hypothetical protein
MSKLNCWEHFNCEREEGGGKVGELGVCPASKEKRLDSVNNGKNGGRACWVIAQTLCSGTVQGDNLSKMTKCLKCEFKKTVIREENFDFVNTRGILAILGG